MKACRERAGGQALELRLPQSAAPNLSPSPSPSPKPSPSPSPSPKPSPSPGPNPSPSPHQVAEFFQRQWGIQLQLPHLPCLLVGKVRLRVRLKSKGSGSG